MTNAFITPLTSEVNTPTKTICVLYAFLLTLYKLLSCNWVLPPAQYLQDVLIWMAGSTFFVCHPWIIGITPGLCEMAQVSERTVGQFHFHPACWNLPKGCATPATNTLHFVHIWLLRKQGEVTNLALMCRQLCVHQLMEKLIEVTFFLFSTIKNSITIGHRNTLKCSFMHTICIFSLCPAL